MKAVNWFYWGCFAYVVCIYLFTKTWPSTYAFDLFYWLIEKEEEWFQKWAGALSGWIAAAGALLAALLALPHLKKQASEAKRQADFVLGDALPTADILEHREDEEILVLVIRNWNRRTLIIKDIYPRHSEYELLVWGHNRADRASEDPKRLQAYPIEGWTNRNAEPPSIFIDISTNELDEDGLVTEWKKVGDIAIEITVIGDRHENDVLVASI